MMLARAIFIEFGQQITLEELLHGCYDAIKITPRDLEKLILPHVNKGFVHQIWFKAGACGTVIFETNLTYFDEVITRKSHDFEKI